MKKLVKTPICTFCAKTGMLCKTCKNNLRLGKISDFDVRLSKLLLDLEKKHARLQKTKFINAFRVEDYVILVGDSSLKEVFTNNKIRNDLKAELNAKLIVLTKQKNDKKTLDEIFHPMTLDGINKIFVPDGTYELKVRLKGDKTELPLSLKDMQTIASKVIDADIRVKLVNETDEWKIADKKIEVTNDIDEINDKGTSSDNSTNNDKRKEQEDELLKKITTKKAD